MQVCPVGATYQTADGVVLVDRKWCIGCGYCIMGCPYGVRFFHPVHHVAEKCNFCYHRISKGMKTACVQCLPVRRPADRQSEGPQRPGDKDHHERTGGVLKEEYGTKPQVFYLGLGEGGEDSHRVAMVHGELWTLKEFFVYPNEYIYWSIQIVMYPFMTGLVAGAFVLSSLYHVFGVKQLKDIARFSLVFSFALLPVAMMPLMLHLQQPFRGITS